MLGWHLVAVYVPEDLLKPVTNSCSSSRNCISYYRSWGSSCRFSCSSEALPQNQHCKSLPPKSKTEFWCNFSSGQSRARPEMTPMEKSPSRRSSPAPIHYLYACAKDCPRIQTTNMSESSDSAWTAFWDQRYAARETPWRLHAVPAALRSFVKGRRRRGTVLIPGCRTDHDRSLAGDTPASTRRNTSIIPPDRNAAESLLSAP